MAGKLWGSGVVEFELSGILVPWCDIITYTGIDFTFGSSEVVDCKKRSQKFISVVRSVLLHKIFSYKSLFSALLISKCLPILSHELDRLMLDSKSLDSVSKAWNTAFYWLVALG